MQNQQNNLNNDIKPISELPGEIKPIPPNNGQEALSSGEEKSKDVAVKSSDSAKLLDTLTPADKTIKPPKAAVSPPPIPKGYRPPEVKETTGASSAPLSATIQRSSSRPLKILLIILVSIVALAGIFYLFFYRATIYVNPSPPADKITLDGSQVQPGSYKVLPGVHSLRVSKEGYISLNLTRNFKIGQRLNLGNLPLQKALTPQLVSKGATQVMNSQDHKLVNFVSDTGQIKTFEPTQKDNTFTLAALSIGTFTNIRKLMFSSENNFAFILDNQAFRVVDFTQSDLINQLEEILPPPAAAIHSFSTNSVDGDFFGHANSQIVYDLKTEDDWFLKLADRDHKQSQILMQIDETQFSTISMDWGQNPRAILLTGGIAGTYDLPTRIFQKISTETGFVSGSWGPNATYAVCLKEDGSLYVLKDNNLENTKFKTVGDSLTWLDENQAMIVSDGQPVLINFDTGKTINYAEINGLQQSSFIAVSGNFIFFITPDGLQAGQLQESPYKL